MIEFIDLEKIINNYLNIKESFEMPDKLLSVLMDKTKKGVFLDKIYQITDLSKDCFRDYFQEQHSDRNELKQDYTPDCVSKLIRQLQPKSKNILDVCSGTGTLILETIKNQDSATIQCEEISSRALPVLICNLALRNITATVIKKDVITNQIMKCYALTSGEKFSDISEIKDIKNSTYDLIISNPPYSLSWKQIRDERFEEFELPPKAKADYVFVLDILSRLEKEGIAFIILPHGTLFRGQAEEKIRKQLLEKNTIDTIIGLPDKLFLNTGIPVYILVLKKNKKDEDILIVDASKNYEKDKKQNVMTDEHIKKIVDVYKNRKCVDRFSSIVKINEIKENDYNLNIPRYVDTSEPPPAIDIANVSKELISIDLSIRETNKNVIEMIKQLQGTSPENDRVYKEIMKPFIESLEQRI